MFAHDSAADLHTRHACSHTYYYLRALVCVPLTTVLALAVLSPDGTPNVNCMPFLGLVRCTLTTLANTL